jgi:hypothetical protein
VNTLRGPLELRHVGVHHDHDGVVEQVVVEENLHPRRKLLSHLLGTLLAWLELQHQLGQLRVDLYFNVLLLHAVITQGKSATDGGWTATGPPHSPK